MGWTKKVSWSYNKYVNDGRAVATYEYKNTTSVPQVITSVKIKLGTGAKNTQFTTGNSLSGDGTSFTTYAYGTGSDGVQRTSQTETISNTVGRGGNSSSGYYPLASQTALKTFTFTTPIFVDAGETVTIYFTFDGSTSNTTIILFYDDSSYGSVTNGNAVKIYNGSSWVSAIPYVYNGSNWVVATAYVYDGSWKPTKP